MSIEHVSVGGDLILYDSARTDAPAAEWFSPEYWQARHKVVARGGGRGSALFIRDDTRYWVLRHYLRGGMAAWLFRDQYWWTGVERSRAFREFRLLHALRLQGLPVPTAVAARVRRSGFFYRADLLTEAEFSRFRPRPDSGADHRAIPAPVRPSA